MSLGAADWLVVKRGEAPLLLSLPHTGCWIPQAIEETLLDPWIARKDTDWFLDGLYDFAEGLGATTVRTLVSRTVVDVNRDPSGLSLYPGQATTGLCPVMTFDGEPIYRPGAEPGAQEIAKRVDLWFAPYRGALQTEAARLLAQHGVVVLFDCHSIRSVVPRLFTGILPVFNIGTNSLAACDPALTESVAEACRTSGRSSIVDGRFKGGFITRHFGRPVQGVHAIQMEIACRGYLHEPSEPLSPQNWPPPYDPSQARPLQYTLRDVLERCLAFAERVERVTRPAPLS